MERDFSIAPLLVNHQAIPGKNNWVKIFIYEPAEIEVLQARGAMYAVLSLSAKSAVDFTPVMQSILEELHTEYFQQTSGSILQALEKSLDNIHKKLILIGQEDKRLAEDFNFNLLTAVSWGTVLYFGQLGPSRAALLRDNKLFDIDEGEQKTTNLYLSSGVLKANDRVVLGTNQFFKRFNRTSLKKALSQTQNKIVAALESELDPGPARQSQSAIVLYVDIKQVPSPQDEGLRILDSNNPIASQAAVPTSRNNPRRSLNAGSWIGGISQNLKHIFTWKVGRFIPVLPLGMVIVALIALLISLNSDQKWQPTFGPNQELVASATSKINQAQQVSDVNPDRALDLLNQANQSIQDGLADYPQNPELLSLQSQHEQLVQKILVITELDYEKVATVNAKTTQTKLVFDDGNTYLIDAQKHELLSISARGKAAVITSDPKFAEGAFLTLTDSGLMVLSRGQALPISPNGSIGQPENIPDTTQPIAMTGFAQNGYVLDSTGQVYRLPHQTDSVGTISSYFQRPIGGSTLVDVAVDGNIYLLRQDGTINVFLNGEEQSFTLERAVLADQGRAMFASPESEKLYLLHGSAIIAWNKQGKYLGQYQFASNDKWQMATIDFENNNLYVLVENTLVRADLP